MTDNTPVPVIILASRGARGSYLSALLGGHPELFGAPHLNVLAFETALQHQKYCAVPRDSGYHGLLRCLAHLLTGEQTLQAVQAARRWLGQRLDQTGSEIHSELRSLVEPQRLVDYSPLHALYPEAMQRVVDTLPEAPVIHLVASPEEQARTLTPAVWQTLNASMGYWNERGLNHPCMDIFEVGDHLVDWSVTPPVFDPQFSWYRTQKAASELFKTLPEERRLRIHTEDLNRAPEEVLGRILPFLGCASGADTISAMIANPDLTFAHVGPFDAASGVDFDMLSNGNINTPAIQKEIAAGHALDWRGDDDILLPELIELATSLGYTVSQ